MVDPRTQLPSPATLKALVASLAWNIAAAERYPSRPDLRRRLGRIKDAARPGKRDAAREFLRRELADLNVAGLLALKTLDVPRDLRHRVDRVLLRAKNSGPGKLYPDPGGGPDALEHCALIVTMILLKGTGKWCGQWNSGVHQACENLWLAAGGKSHGGVAEAGTLTAWRRHLLTARRRYLPPHPAGIVIERILEPPAIERRLISAKPFRHYVYPRFRANNPKSRR